MNLATSDPELLPEQSSSVSAIVEYAEEVHIPPAVLEPPVPSLAVPTTQNAEAILQKTKLEEIAEAMDEGALASLVMLKELVKNNDARREDRISASRVILGSAGYLKARREDDDGEDKGNQIVVHLNIKQRESTASVNNALVALLDTSADEPSV